MLGSETIDPLRAAAEAAPDDPEPHFRLGEALFERSALREAVPALQQAVRLKQDHLEALVLLGRALIGLGNEPAGNAAVLAALNRAPRRAASLSKLGLALQAAGLHREALTCFERAIELQPRTAAHHYNRGISLRALERLDDAIAAYRRAIDLRPDYARAHNNLGSCLRRRGRLADAEKALRKAVDLDPEWFAPHYNLGRVLDKRERPGEAVVELRKAIRLNPKHVESHLRLGVVLQEIGQLELARESYRRVLQLSPDHAAAHGLLSIIDNQPLERPTLERLEAKIGSAEAPVDRQNLHFALAHRYDQLGEYGRAFDHLIAGNRLKRAELSYKLEKDVDRFRRLMEVFDRDFLERHQGAGNPSRLPVFVLGMPRSGSTLIEQILASHSGVHGAGEIPALGEIAGETLKTVLFKSAGRLAVDPGALGEIGVRYVEEIRRRGPHAQRVVDKMLVNFNYIGLIKLALPNAQVIHAQRHPLDNCISIFRKLFSGGLAFSYDLEELGTYYRWYARLMRHWHEVLPGFVLDVRYEDMIEDQRGTTERILAHCGLEWEDACLRFHETQRPVRTASVAQVRKPIYRSSAGVWKRYGERLRPLIDALAEEIDPAEFGEVGDDRAS